MYAAFHALFRDAIVCLVHLGVGIVRCLSFGKAMRRSEDGVSDMYRLPRLPLFKPIMPIRGVGGDEEIVR